MTTPPPPGQPPGQPGGGYSYGYPRPPKHREATTVLVFGILGLVVCQFFAPFAWWKANRVLEEIRSSPVPLDGESEVNIGRILGIVGTVLLALTAVMFAVLAALYGVMFIIMIASMSATAY